MRHALPCLPLLPNAPSFFFFWPRIAMHRIFHFLAPDWLMHMPREVNNEKGECRMPRFCFPLLPHAPIFGGLWCFAKSTTSLPCSFSPFPDQIASACWLSLMQLMHGYAAVHALHPRICAHTQIQSLRINQLRFQ